MNPTHRDIDILKSKLVDLPTFCEGKSSVLELKAANYNWRQMEWLGFYFELKIRERLKGVFQIPGDKFDQVEFDLKSGFNWDIKTKARQSKSKEVILNDVVAMDQSIETHGYHGEIVGVFDVTYNDNDRSFKRWHDALKGGPSSYERKRMEQQGSPSRRRKTSAVLLEIYYILLGSDSLLQLGKMHQGKNSNEMPRPPKYMLNLEKVDEFKHERQPFDAL